VSNHERKGVTGLGILTNELDCLEPRPGEEGSCQKMVKIEEGDEWRKIVLRIGVWGGVQTSKYTGLLEEARDPDRSKRRIKVNRRDGSI